MMYFLQTKPSWDNAEIVAAIIGAFATLLAVLIPLYLSRKKTIAGKSRYQALNGIYYGHVWQAECDDTCELEITAKKNSRVTGFLTVHYKEFRGFAATVQKMKIDGFFYFDDLLTLSYVNQSPSKQAGVILLRFLETGDGFEGEFIGYGPVFKSLEDGKGKLSLRRNAHHVEHRE